MAREENQQKNSLNRKSPDCKNKLSDGVDKESLGTHRAKISDMEYKIDDSQPSPVDSIKKRKGSGKGNKSRSGLSREKSDDKDLNSSESAELLRNLRDTSECQFPCNASETRDEEGTFSHMFEGVPTENVMNKCRFLDMVVGMNFRVVVLYVFRTAVVWLEQLKPQFRMITSLICNGHNYVRVKVNHAYPIIWTWTSRFSKLMFFLSMVWLDCSIRGLDSLLRLGATSFLTVIWCSILSFSAMIGLTKMLIVLIISILLVLFIGLGLTILVVAALGIVVFCLYGSFWTTGTMFFLGGVSFIFGHERIALLVTTLYSMYCARSYVGWLGLLSGLNLAFISSDLLVYFLKNIEIDPSEQARETQGKANHSFGESSHSSPGDDAFFFSSERSADRSPGFPSTSGTESEMTSEDEVVRLLNSTDHYSALGFSRYANIDASQLKKEYRKKAMLVHPDKNMGNEKAAEAFKKLQNAYEVLLDSLKRKIYDDELRREELLNYFRRFQSTSQKGRQGIFRPGFSHSEAEYEGPYSESRKIACKRCNDCHLWGCTERSKSQARWCQDCKDFHQSKDGDGWVEQTSQPLLFGLFQKMDPPRAFVCAESRIYNVTEWFICQGMRCPANTHKPSFHVNASLMKQTSSKGNSATARGGGAVPASNIDDTMTEEEFFEWLQNAVHSGNFEANSTPDESGSPRNGSCSKSSAKKKRKGKKQW